MTGSEVRPILHISNPSCGPSFGFKFARRGLETSSNELGSRHPNARSSGHEPRLSTRPPKAIQWSQVPRNLLFSAAAVPIAL